MLFRRVCLVGRGIISLINSFKLNSIIQFSNLLQWIFQYRHFCSWWTLVVDVVKLHQNLLLFINSMLEWTVAQLRVNWEIWINSKAYSHHSVNKFKCIRCLVEAILFETWLVLCSVHVLPWWLGSCTWHIAREKKRGIRIDAILIYGHILSYCPSHNYYQDEAINAPGRGQNHFNCLLASLLMVE